MKKKEESKSKGKYALLNSKTGSKEYKGNIILIASDPKNQDMCKIELNILDSDIQMIEFPSTMYSSELLKALLNYFKLDGDFWELSIQSDSGYFHLKDSDVLGAIIAGVENPVLYLSPVCAAGC